MLIKLLLFRRNVSIVPYKLLNMFGFSLVELKRTVIGVSSVHTTPIMSWSPINEAVMVIASRRLGNRRITTFFLLRTNKS